MEKKVITFDIWDTILKRTCHPEEIKVHTLRYYYYKEYFKIKEEYRNELTLYRLRDSIEVEEYEKARERGVDGECNFREVLATLIERTHLGTETEKEILKQELPEYEINREIEKIYINPLITDIFNKYDKNTKYCISDFYMPKEDLIKILNAHGLDKKFKEIYVSADIMKTKRDEGHLFEYFSEKENIKYENMIHVGDNQHSDIDMAKRYGIETIKIPNPKKYNFDINNLGNIDLKLDNIKKDTNTENLAKLTRENLKEYKKSLYNQGIEFSAIAYYYIYDIIIDAVLKGYDKIYYQTREGETFIKFHEIIEKNNPFPFKVPKAELIEVSRVATFAASLDEFNVQNLLRIWSQYRAQSMKALFKSLDIDIEKYNEYFKKYDIDKEMTIYEPWFNFKVTTLLQDKEFKKEIEEELKEKRERLLEYLKGKGIENKEGNKIYLVDIGWRGTIQDNLAFVLDKAHIEGGYIALFDYYNPQRENVAKRALIRDSKVTWEYVALTLTIYEMMFSSDTKSVAGYENGKAIRKGKKEEVDFVKNIILPIREGMIDGAKYIAKFMKERDIMEDMYLGYLYNLAREIKENPSKILVEAYYSLVYNETFGTGEYLNGRKKVTGLKRFNIIYVRNLMRNEPWKESLIVGNDLGFYVWLLNHKHIVPDTLRKGKNGIKKVLSLGKRGVKKACRGAKKVVKFTIRKIKGQK
jgi:hypothetical protein